MCYELIAYQNISLIHFRSLDELARNLSSTASFYSLFGGIEYWASILFRNVLNRNALLSCFEREEPDSTIPPLYVTPRIKMMWEERQQRIQVIVIE